MTFIDENNIEYKKVKYLRQGETFIYDYEFLLNVPLADWDVWDYWERGRVESMRTHLNKNDILFDIGTESGWCNLVYASMIKAENIVLIEPTAEFWPNIKALWYKNYNVKPLACYDGLFSDKTNDTRIDFTEFPESSFTGKIIDKNKYAYLHEDHNDILEITLDEFVKRTKIIPTALTMDVEGAELLVLKGAKNTLLNNNLKVWISIHDDLAEQNYSIKPLEVIKYMESLGYNSEFISLDHEAHWYFSK